MTDVLSLFTFKPAAVDIGNGNTVHIRRLSGADKVAWLDSIPDDVAGDVKPTAADNLDRSARLLQKTLCNESGTLLFDSPDPIKQIDDATIERLVGEAMRVNGWGKAGEDDVAKKLGDTPPSSDS